MGSLNDVRLPPSLETREQLLERKQELDSRLGMLRISLDEAMGLARAKGVYLPPHEYARRRREVAELGAESQRLQRQIGKLRDKGAQHEAMGMLFLQEFYLAARRHVEPELFKKLAREAEAALAQKKP